MQSSSDGNRDRRIPVIDGTWRGAPARFRPDRVIVRLQTRRRQRRYDDLAERCEALCRLVPGAKVLRYPKGRPVMVLELPENTRVTEIAEMYSGRDDVAYAEPDFIGEIGIVPSDSRYDEQWGPPKINAEAAWDLETGAATIVIGIIDTGLATATDGSLNHPDLDDASRYILGTDFVNDDALPRDDHSHGTHVAIFRVKPCP